MKTCPNCKASYQEDDKKFCKKCGTELTTVYSIPAQEMAKKTVFEDRLTADPLMWTFYMIMHYSFSISCCSKSTYLFL